MQKVMDGRSFLDMKVRYSNSAGNCTLIVCSDNERATPDDIGSMFLHRVIDLLGDMALKKFILETYVRKHMEKDQRLVFFMQRYEYVAWFADAKIVSALLGIRKCVSDPDGYEFVYIDRERFRRYADYLVDGGWEVDVIDVTDFGR